MASVLAAVHPDRFAAVAVHSGVPYRAAGGAREAMAAMQGGGPNVEELAQRLREALGERTPPPLLVMHGSEDQAVAPVNGRRLAAAWLRVAGRAGPPEGGAGSLLPAADRDEAHTGSGVHPWRLRAWESDGPRVELREVEGLGHAWSGGDPAGSYTDPEGPDATAWVVEFFERASGSAAGEAADPHPDDEGPARARAP